MIGAVPPGPGLAQEGAVAAPTRRIASAALLGGQRELIIEHGAACYRLRLTSTGKLILTK